MDESIAISSDSSSPPRFLQSESDSEFPTAKLIDICGGPKFELNLPSTSSRVSYASFGPTLNGRSVLISERKKPKLSNEAAHSLSDGDSDNSQPVRSSKSNPINVPVAKSPKNTTPRKPAKVVHDISDDDSDTSQPVWESSCTEQRSDSNCFNLPDKKSPKRSTPRKAATVIHDISDDDSDNCNNPFNIIPKNSTALSSFSEPILSNSFTIDEFDTQLTTNSQLPSGPSYKNKRAQNSAVTIVERKRLKELKMKEKAEKAAVAENLRRMRPGECVKYVTMVLDSNIITEYSWGKDLMEIFLQSDTKHAVEPTSDPCTVKWTRQQPVHVVEEEKHVVFLWSVDKLLTSIKFSTLIDTFALFKDKYKSYRLYLAIHGLHNYYKKRRREADKQNQREASQIANPPRRKRKSGHDITEQQIEMELIALQIKFGISHKALATTADVATYLQNLTKSIAELPYKLMREKVDQERNWYAKGDSKKCARVDKDFNGLDQLWLQQLSQFNNTSLDTAKAIAQLYPTPRALYDAFNQCATDKEKCQMLQDLVVKRGSDGGGRRLGPELSRKISILFCQEQDILLA